MTSADGASPGGAAAAGREWRTHGGDPGHTQYSPLNQINRDNVHRLRAAWTYRTGDGSDDGRSQIQCNPIVIDGVLYATTARVETFALDAATGRELWRFNPYEAGASKWTAVNRGVVYWSGGDDRRIFVTAGQRLFALVARTGRRVNRASGRTGASISAKGSGGMRASCSWPRPRWGRSTRIC
ncbi:MAG: PQQ-binding-like beta-propeller repeat protein [Longimicrobiales bacterium]